MRSRTGFASRELARHLRRCPVCGAGVRSCPEGAALQAEWLYALHRPGRRGLRAPRAVRRLDMWSAALRRRLGGIGRSLRRRRQRQKVTA